jgi:FkbM family methyltransferase
MQTYRILDPAPAEPNSDKAQDSPAATPRAAADADKHHSTRPGSRARTAARLRSPESRQHRRLVFTLLFQWVREIGRTEHVISTSRLLTWIRHRWEGLQATMQFDNWPFLIIQRCCLQTPMVYRKRNVRFLVDRAGGDQYGLIECLARDMYSRCFSRLPKGRPVRVLDLGANSGGFGLALIVAGFEIERIVAVEMNLRTHARLAFNLVNNIGSNAALVHAAVCEAKRSVLVADNGGWVGNSIYDQHPGDIPTLEVPGVTLDELTSTYFPNGRADILKMDIEFAEYEVLFSETCKSIVQYDYLLIEIHEDDHRKKDSLIQRLDELNFEMLAGESNRWKGVYFFGNRLRSETANARESTRKQRE